ncbi:MAG: Crp/Fnr family transcriptional regulator [Ferruginibacter sp.]|nr:Crp/Fnr family transcriptional regulator [Ferruginibacter sp.]
MESLRNYLAGNNFSEPDIEKIADAFEEKHYLKGDYFVQEGKTSKQLGFVEKGFVQYFVLIDGEEKTTYSVGENNFVTSLVSFLQQVPSKENIRAVMETIIWVIDRNGLNQLQEDLPAFKNFYITLLEWQICCIDESRLDAIMLTARQRYEKMLRKEPTLIQQIPLQYLASILGVTPRHLSRIRNSIR